MAGRDIVYGRMSSKLRLFAAVVLVLSGLAVLSVGEAWAADYYLDARRGNDVNDGQSGDRAWRSLARLRDVPLQPGDRILLAAGSTWKEPLVLTRSGSRGKPILIAPVGEGARPRIDAGGVSSYAVALLNVQFVAVKGLELTNDGPVPDHRFGVLIAAENTGVLRDIRVSDMYIHDVRGTNERKDNGGIVFRALGPKVPTRFEGLTIEGNILWRVDRSGIAGISDQVSAARWFPSRAVVIRDNYLEDIGGDGIVPRGTDGALVEHNIVLHAGSRAPGYVAAIWQWSTDHSLIQLNEAAFTRTRYDGQGFDSDFNSRRTTIIYNYSHDNAGGFLLTCTPRRDAGDNLGNHGTRARFNVSRNDGTRIFQLAGGISGTSIEGNVIHVGTDMDVQMVVATNWDGWPGKVKFRDNVFAVAGTGRYGSEVGRQGPDYLIVPGFTQAGKIRFYRNRYLGRHVDVPADKAAIFNPDYQQPAADWSVPTFDPARAEGFRDFIESHRRWMLAMLSRELGHPVALKRPRKAPMPAARR